ncbi:hypothetical protein [Acetonema longum]|nr:hypothetical protein [Acetonema longum]
MAKLSHYAGPQDKWVTPEWSLILFFFRSDSGIIGGEGLGGGYE